MNQPPSMFQRLTSRLHAMTLMPKGGSLCQMRNDSATTTLLPSILVVDDDLSVLEMLHDALDLWGFDVFLAKNGREGLNVLARQKVDDILLDVDMPVMDGLTMLDELRCLGFSIPVVMMSGNVTGRDLRQLVNKGAQDFISKPFSLSSLQKLCARIFEKHGIDAPPGDHSPVVLT